MEYEIRVDWIEQMNAILGYDNSDGFHSEPDPHTIAKGMVSTIGMLERRVHGLESILDLMFWFQVATYRHLIHRHDGTFRAVDESTKEEWNTTNIHELIHMINDNQHQIMKNILPQPPRPSDAMRRFNALVEVADRETKYQFDTQPVEVLVKALADSQPMLAGALLYSTKPTWPVSEIKLIP